MNRSILLFTMLIALISLSYGQGINRAGCGQAPPFRMSQELNLTEEQAQQMKDLRMDHESTMIDLNASLKQERLNMRKLMGADEPNKKKIYAQLEKINSVDMKIQKARVDHRLAMRSTLSAEQLKVYKQGMMMKGRQCGPDGPGVKGDRGNRPHRRF
ncbi:MAG: Spy/CpxP family protein refolding chaperone [Candidatus Marinimicrobia bacterium]|nr:Spy/CpxP family protein refolding chaperone [Candidatus Neomarinimicrobiota bacterium]MCF7851559.1 Spy/CpxP family protein refolding chaperone [Candidatus Neomarinimicrobiota bacterium]MCF7904679.1 Spy/CpxP family protein refolding chaperone [Candidatus Neomarinimicrobiota bacterium]